MGLFGGGGTVDIEPFLKAAREAQEKGEGKIADFETVANDFASMGNANYQQSQELYGDWQKTVDSYYSNLNENEFGAQAQQAMLQQQDKQYSDIRSSLSSQGIDPGSSFALDIYDQSGEQGAAQQGQAQIDAKYNMYSMQQDWTSYGVQQQGQLFDNYAQGVNMQGRQAQSYTNMYSSQAQSSYALASQQQSYNQAVSGGSGMFGTLGSIGGTVVGGFYGGPAGAGAGGSAGGMVGGAIDGGF